MEPKRQPELRAAPVTRQDKIKDMMRSLIFSDDRMGQRLADRLYSGLQLFGVTSPADIMDSADENARWKEANGIPSGPLDKASDITSGMAMLIGPGGAGRLARAGMKRGWGDIEHLKPAMERLNKGANPASIWRDFGWGNNLPDLGGTSMPHYMGAFTALDPREIKINPGAFRAIQSGDDTMYRGEGRIGELFDWPEMMMAYSNPTGKYKTPFHDLKINRATIEPSINPGINAHGVTSIPEPQLAILNREQRRRGVKPTLEYADPSIANMTVERQGDQITDLMDPNDPAVRALKSTFAHEGGHVAAAMEGSLPTGASALAGTRVGMVKPQYDFSPRARAAKSAAIERANAEGISGDDIFRPFAQHGFNRPALDNASRELKDLVAKADEAATTAAYYNNPGELGMRWGQSGMERNLHPSDWWTGADPWDLKDIGRWNLREQGWAPDTASVVDMMERMKGLK